ncbi:hypothetical protein PR202_ga05334 [Eleusine coracana subsp. coracana]|uniref:Protein kinase domain-containing protein n=1 Tax=Eleusine coracana subsp. coracana TaxID=191504 RepID=A0AAV5BS50_ELECO|nr:hypothetical protein PR202_ga04881 [Eleusine coracana subsp. coracana]GJM89173.1 hypothetical protein PR202_ga05334 [Eleusine coracana subsp. coracana]
MVRYPDDPYDRIWQPTKINTTQWTVIYTEETVQNYDDDKFEAPSKALQTAITPRIVPYNIQFQWCLSPNPSSGCFHVFYFSELEPLPSKAVRQFYININDDPPGEGYTPPYLYSGAVSNKYPYRGYTKYFVMINATANSTLPPIINAFESFYVISTAKFGTDSQDEWVNNSVKPQKNEMSRSHVPTGDYQSSLRLENRRFTYDELAMITNNFQHVIGRGGFGYVYNGFLEDGTQVAVKLRSESSNQGVREFLTEAQILTRIHHKNLVSMIGYCKDEDYMALVYEYMSEGALQEHITGKVVIDIVLV